MNTFMKDSSEFQLNGVLETKSDHGTALLLGADPEACQASSEILERCGLKTLRLSSLAELREAIRERKPCLLLCEDIVPEGDFRDVLKCAVSSKQEVPVIVFSRLADWERYLDAVGLGAYDLLRFPFRTGELQGVLGRALADSRLVFPGQATSRVPEG